MPEYCGIEYLRQKLANKRTRVERRYRFYEMKNFVKDFGISSPPELRQFQSALGWCAKGVDSLADRLVFHSFKNDIFNIQEIFDRNNPDILADSACLSALISSCCFIYISNDESEYPRLQVIEGGDATGTINPITGLLLEGYAVLERDKHKRPVTEAYFTKEKTEIYQGNKVIMSVENPTGIPLLVPIIFRPDARRPFGHSRISRACMSAVEGAIRTIKRSEISAEFYSFPQKYVSGLSPDREIDLEKWSAAMSAMMTFDKDEEGDHPVIGQFTQQSMEPHINQFKMFASMFAGETGLTLDDLGIVTENPSSAEAIKAAHENLRLTARKAQRTFGSGLLNTGYVAACLRDKYTYNREVFFETKAIWEPIFEPDASMLSAIGDGAIKINQAVPGYLNKDNLRELTGIESED